MYFLNLGLKGLKADEYDHYKRSLQMTAWQVASLISNSIILDIVYDLPVSPFSTLLERRKKRSSNSKEHSPHQTKKKKNRQSINPPIFRKYSARQTLCARYITRS